VGVAYAQGPQPPVGDRPLYGSDACDGSGAYGHAGRMGGGRAWGMRGFSLVDATAEATGLTVDEVVAALQDGQTFAQIAGAQGVDPQAIVDGFLADREAALAEAVADGRLTQERADWMLEEMSEHVSGHLEQPWTPRNSNSGGGRMGDCDGDCDGDCAGDRPGKPGAGRPGASGRQGGSGRTVTPGIGSATHSRW